MIISSKKYACETCIKGHRSSACKHSDRPLFEIKKKGRPVTQCEHCRELRKTKQVHVKCSCESKAYNNSQPSSSSAPTNKGTKPGFESAAFPHGLPEALETSVAIQNSADGASSDSDHGGLGSSCMCKAGGDCQCCTPRQAPSRNRNRSVSDGQQASPADGYMPPRHPSRTSSQIMARIAELRPVLPRPPAGTPVGGPVHNPSTSTPRGHHTSRHHDNVFSPYGRAYGMSHLYLVQPQSYPISPEPSTSSYPVNEQTFSDHYPVMPASNGAQWVPPNTEVNDTFPSMCGCGDGCQCPGCFHHNGAATAPSSTAFSSCTNPGACAACLDCTILSLPPFLPADTALSIPNQTDSIDEWLRQISSNSTTAPAFDNYATQSFDQQSWDNRLSPIPDSSSAQLFSQPDCCVTRCICPPGQCDCESCESQDSFPSAPDVFATSMERTSPCLSKRRQSASSSAPYNDRALDPALFPPGSLLNNSYYMMADQSRSRSPSTSSQSSQQGSLDRSSMPGSVPYRPSGRIQGLSVFGNVEGVRSAPQLNVRPPLIHTGPTSSSTSVSPIPGSRGRAVAPSNQLSYAASNPGSSEGSYDGRYDPTLDSMNIC